MTSFKRALAWANAGWPVFPVRANKKPWFADWNEVATTDRKQIEKWWQHDTGDGSYNVGIVPAMAAPRCFVLDVDTKGGHDGEQSLAALAETLDFNPADYAFQETPSGGRHLFMHGSVPTTAGKLGDGLDTRGGFEDGTSRGYVLAYVDTPPATPEECLNAPAFTFGQRTERAADTQTPLVPFDEPVNVSRAAAYLMRVTPTSEGGRNAALFKHVCMIKDLGISLEEAASLIKEFPNALGLPEIEEEEALVTIRSAYENGQAAPGQHAVDMEAFRKLAAEVAASAPTKAKAPGGKRLIFWPEMEHAAPPNWIVKGVVPDNSLVGLVGQGGSYKSFLVLDLALAVATNQPAWGGREIRRHGPVVLIQGEGRLDNRALAWQAVHETIGERMAMIPGMDLNDAEDVAAVALAIREAQDNVWFAPPALIVVDTLARASGGADENSSKDMGKIVAHCDALRKSFGCTVVLVHHTPKSGRSWRGSTAVYFALDTAIEVRGRDLTAHLEVVRQKDGEIGGEWTAKLDRAPTGRQVDGSIEHSLVVRSLIETKGEAEDGVKRMRAKAQEQKERIILQGRERDMEKILLALPPGQTLPPGKMAKHLAATRREDGEAVGLWIKRALADGKLDRFIAVRVPLEFGALTPSQEKTPGE